ncbi:MAG: sulfatase [Verrucomicrobiota bacterium]
MPHPSFLRIILSCLPLLPWIAEAEKPNIVIIFADDLGYGDLGCYGSPTIRTPHLDQMAREGLRFTDFYVAASVCTPSRAALLTGRYPIRNGMCSNDRRVLFPESEGGLPDEEFTIAEGLKKVGYATMHVGKWHLGIHEGSRPTDQGFDHSIGIPYSNDMDPNEGIKHREHAGNQNPPADGWNVPLLRNNEVIERPADQTTLTKRYTKEAITFIDANRDQPFFLYLAHTFPHVPLFASPEFHGKSRAGRYGDVVEELDWSVGQILTHLQSSGLADNTLVVFTSDNGPWTVMHDEGGSAGPLRDGKGSTWEGGMRVPAIAWWPGTIEPGRTPIVASTMDLFTTSLALGGAALPEDVTIDGRDLSSFFREGKLPPKKAFFFYRGRELFACRWGPWKAHFKTKPAYANQPVVTHDPPALYHLARDPSEKRLRPIHGFGEAALAEIQAEVEKHQASLNPAKPQF